MARTRRSIPGRWKRTAAWSTDFTRDGDRLSYHERAKRGLVKHEISGEFRQGHLDSWDTRTSGGKSTKAWKRLAGKIRRRFTKDVAFHGGDQAPHSMVPSPKIFCYFA